MPFIISNFRRLAKTDAGTRTGHLIATARLAAPIAVALLSEMAMGLTDTVMLGSIGDRALAAGGLGANLFFTTLIILQGVLSGVSVLAATARGAGCAQNVPKIYWSGVTLAAGLAVPLFAALSLARPALLALGESAGLADDIATYLQVLRWGVPAGLMGIGMMRQFLPAIGLQRVLLWVVPGGVAVNAALNWQLIHGGLGLPGFGLRGSAAATATTMWLLTLGMLAVLHGGRFRHFVTFSRPDGAVVRRLLGFGVPVGATVTVEASLFLASCIMAGELGPAALAAHMVAMSVTISTFMVPLAISQAAGVRVAEASGAGNLPAARRAGFMAVAFAAAFMGCSALVLTLVPAQIASAYLTHSGLAARLLRIAGLFQIADGVQVVASAALRGLGDTRIPMLLAAMGYWGIGFLAARRLAFALDLGAAGLWWGLCAGLVSVAVSLVLRFAWRSTVPPGALFDRGRGR